MRLAGRIHSKFNARMKCRHECTNEKLPRMHECFVATNARMYYCHECTDEMSPRMHECFVATNARIVRSGLWSVRESGRVRSQIADQRPAVRGLSGKQINESTNQHIVRGRLPGSYTYKKLCCKFTASTNL